MGQVRFTWVTRSSDGSQTSSRSDGTSIALRAPIHLSRIPCDAEPRAVALCVDRPARDGECAGAVPRRRHRAPCRWDTLAGATVRLDGGDYKPALQTSADASGRYVFESVKPGIWVRVLALQGTIRRTGSTALSP